MAIVLIVAAHPDDETLGCAATAAKRARAGDEVHVRILGTGLAARGDVTDVQLASLRAQARQAAAIMGADSIAFESAPDNAFDTVSLLSLVQHVERWVQDVRPSVIYTHGSYDLNVDHRRTFEAVVTATRPMAGALVREVYTFEVASATEWGFGFPSAFRPTVFEDVRDTLHVKLACLACYDGEARAFPHPRSPEALKATAVKWGSVAGVNAAEAFALVRAIR